MKNGVLLVSSFFAWAAGGGELPPLEFPAGVGVNIHFTRGHGADLDRIAAAGFKWVRMDFGWGGIERQKGQYDWSAYDVLSADLERRGLRALYILDYSNSLYEEVSDSRNPVTGKASRDVASPQHPESVAAFARWAAASARHFQGRAVIWEIWNEPNISFWKPKPDASQYATLALAAAKAVRAADPQAVIIGPASSEFPWAFLETFLASGVLEYLDAVSVHPYRNYAKSPETAGADYQKLRGLIERCAPNEAKKKLPIISGEWGYATHAKGISLEVQAAYAARQQLFNLFCGIPISIWYDWKNDGNDPQEREHNFGTVLPDLSPKPAYTALQVLTRELSGYRIARRLDLANDRDYALVCTNAAGGIKLAAWTLGESHAVTLAPEPAWNSAIRQVDSRSDSISINEQNGKLILELAASPRFWTLKTPH
jgi:polysaccharide biosynthesis protein PslG